MKKEENFSLTKGEISDLQFLIKALEKHVDKFGKAYIKRDHHEFNIIKREILQLQRKIHQLIT